VKRVLIISYYWPPSGGAGVQRWLKFTKYLPDYGWKPVIYTPENPEAPVDDPSLLEDIHPQVEVVKRSIWEPYNLYKHFVGMGSGERVNTGFLKENEQSEKKEGISVWIRGNLFIPDARKFWIKPSVRFLRKYLKDHPVDAIISTGPPHSMHLIALELKRHFKLPWIADFRDPWTEIDFYDQLRLSTRSHQKHKSQENSVLKGADRVVVIGNQMAERFKDIARIEATVIPNGYDEADFKNSPGYSGKEFKIVHVGTMNADRNHPAFWKVISELIGEEPDLTSTLKIQQVGKTDVSVQQYVARFGLQNRVDIESYLPHDQIIPLLQSATVLYLPINNTPNAKSIRTGKIFEYLAAKRPILGIGPVDGDAADVIRECNAGEMIHFDNGTKLKEVLLRWLRLHQQEALLNLETNASKYSRKGLTAKFSGLLNEIT